MNDVILLLIIYQEAQRMSRPVGIPDPIVGIEGTTAIFMHLSIESTVIVSILTQANRTLVATIEGGVEDCLVILRTALHLDLAQRLVPGAASTLRHDIHVISRDLTLQVLLRLFSTDQRYTIAHANLLHTVAVCQSNRHVLTLDRTLSSLSTLSCHRQGLHRLLVSLGIEVDLCLPVDELEAAHRIALCLQLTVACIEDQEGRCLFRKAERIDRTLMRRGVIDINLRIVQIDLITIGA